MTCLWLRTLTGLSAGLMTMGLATPAQAGDVIVCNKKQTTFYIASFHKDGPLSCALRKTNCSIVSAGWWALKPGQCYRPKTGLFYDTYMILMFKGKKGERLSGQFAVNNHVLSGRKYRGSSGVNGDRACVKWSNFDRRISGNWNSAFNTRCPDGYESFPVSMYARSNSDGNETINLR